MSWIGTRKAASPRVFPSQYLVLGSSFTSIVRYHTQKKKEKEKEEASNMNPRQVHVRDFANQTSKKNKKVKMHNRSLKFTP